MNKSRTAVAVGGTVGASLAVAVIWLWETVTGNRGIASVLGTAVFGAVVFLIGRVTRRRAVNAAQNANAHDIKKYAAYYRLLASWMLLRNSGRSLAEYFAEHHYRSVAVYGLGPLGMCLLGELKHSDVEVRCGIDRNADHFSYLDLKVIAPDSPIEAVDAIVITPFFECEHLVLELEGRTSSKIVSLEDIVHSI